MPYTNSFYKIVNGDRHESSLENRTFVTLRLECNFKQILVNSLKQLLFRLLCSDFVVSSRFIIPGHLVSGARQPRLPSSLQVSEIKMIQ